MPSRSIATNPFATLRLCGKVLPIVCALLILGCGSDTGNQETPPPQLTQAPAIDHGKDPWKLTYEGPLHTTPLLLSNGSFSVRLPAILTDDEKLYELSFADIYQPSGEEKLLQLQFPSYVLVDESSNPLSPREVKSVRHELDFKTGAMTTSYAWNQDLMVKVVSLVHPTKRVMVQRWELWSAKRKTSFSADFMAEAWHSGKPKYDGVVEGTKIRYKMQSKSDPTSVSAENWTSDKPYVSELCWAFGDNTGSAPEPMSFSQVMNESKAYWAKQWETDIEIDGPVEDQQAIRSMLFYMKSGISPTAKIAPGPFGLSNQTYNGHVFWDADVWMFPALSMIDPARAKVIPSYRISMAKVAERNFQDARSWARQKPDPASIKSVVALQYPWESSVSGLEVSPTETKQQHHITGTVLVGLDHAAALGLADEQTVSEIGRKAGKFYDWRAGFKEVDGGTRLRTIKDTVSPDENFIGDDDLYTNCVAEWTMRRFPNENTKTPISEFYRPKDAQSFLNYTGDRLKGYKQAAGILAIYPLQDPMVEPQAAKMMDRFSDKVIANGPAMSDSVNALVWARLERTEKAYETWRKSWKEFTNHPLMLFSEKRRKEETYFLTGAGGSLQTVLYGFIGFRIDLKQQPGAGWTTQLKGGYWLSVKPNLPTGWKKVTLRNFTVLGKRYTLTATPGAVRVTSGDN